jgi:hypothetical protein
LDNEQTQEVLTRLYGQTKEGSLSFKNLAGEFAPVFAQQTSKFSEQGVEAAVLAGALAQTIASSLKTVPEAATMQERLYTSLSKETVQKGLREKAGIEIADKETGELKPLAEVLKLLGEAAQPGKPLSYATTRQEIFPELKAVEGLETFLADLARAPKKFSRLAETPAAVGAEEIEKTLAALDLMVTAQITDLQIEAASVTLIADELTETATEAAGISTRAEKELGVPGQVLGLGVKSAAALAFVEGAVTGDRRRMRRIFDVEEGSAIDKALKFTMKVAGGSVIPGMETIQALATSLNKLLLGGPGPSGQPQTVELSDSTVRKSAEATAEALARRSRPGGGPGDTGVPSYSNPERQGNPAGR